MEDNSLPDREFVVISHHDWPELLIITAKTERQAMEIAVAQTIKWCIECDPDWIATLDGEISTRGTPILQATLKADGYSGIIELYAPLRSDLSEAQRY